MNHTLALRLVGLVLSQMAGALRAPRLRSLRVDVVVSPTAETAATGYNARRVEIMGVLLLQGRSRHDAHNHAG